MRFRDRLICLLIILVLSPAFLPGASPDDRNLDRAVLTLNSASIPFEKRSLFTEYGGFGTSLLVKSTANDEVSLESTGTFVFAVPLYADFAVDTALAMARSHANNLNESPGVNVLIAFLGDEINKLPPEFDGITHLGLRDLLSLNDMPENWILCYLDADIAPEEIVIRHGARGYVAPLEIISPLPHLFRSRDIPWSFRIRFNEIYKLGLVEGPGLLFITWAEEINSFLLSGTNRFSTLGQFSYHGGDTELQETVSPEDLAGLLLDYSGTLEFPVLKTDRHYSTYSLPGGRVFFLGEGHIVILLLVMTGILLLQFLLFSSRHNAIMVFRIKLFFKSSWIFLVLLPLFILLIKISGHFYFLLLRTFGPPLENASINTANYLSLGLSVLLAILVFFLPSPIMNLIRLPRRALFYGVSALFFIIIGILISAFLDFSYVPVFLWAFIIVFLGASVSNPILVFLCVILTPLFAIGALINIFETGANRIIELMITPQWNSMDSWKAALQTGLLALPLILLAKRGNILAQIYLRKGREIKPKRAPRLVVVSVMIVLVSITMLIQIKMLPGPQIAPDRRFINEDSVSGEKILNMDLDDLLFQDSRILTLNLRARGNPTRFDVLFESMDGESLLPIYSAPVPFHREDEGEIIAFSLGEYPPNPMSLEIVVPKNFDGLLSLAAIYDIWDSAVDPLEKPKTDDYVLKVSRSEEVHSR